MSKTLISSRYFFTLHLRRARPLLIVHDVMVDRLGTYNMQKLFVSDESLNKEEEEKMFTKLLLKRDLMINEARKDRPVLQYSCAGVLLFQVVYTPLARVLFNPITQEEVAILHEFYHGHLCAFYYCSLTRQFKLLYARTENSLCQYSIYSVRTRTWRRIIRCPTPNLLTNVKPAIVNGAVHLIMGRDLKNPAIPPCAEGIMVFNMDQEEFSTMPHPGSYCSSWKILDTMSLLVKDECLCLCQLFIFENRLDIWILEDYEARLWTNICKVKLVFNNHGVRNMYLVQRYTYWKLFSTCLC